MGSETGPAASGFADPTTFPILRELAFFNHAGVAPLSGPAAEALRRYADHAARRAYVDSGWHRQIRQVKQLAAKLIGARGEHEIAFVPNTSTGLALVARGLSWQAGDQVITTSVEFPANRYPWQDLERLGVELVEVAPQPDGRIEVDDVIEAITDRTRLVAISHVQYSSGHRIELSAIAETIHQAGGYLCVDAIQSVGALPVDVQAMGVDFLSADGHKWMLSPEGAGIFYCHEDLCRQLHPNVVGWMSMVEAHDFGNYRFELQPDARRFEPGSYNVPGILAMGASLELLLSVGLDAVWQQIEALTGRLCAGLAEKGYRVFSPRQFAHERSGIVVFDVPADKLASGGATSGGPGRIVRDLQDQGIIIVVREGRLRASPHFYNSEEQIDRLIDALP